MQTNLEELKLAELRQLAKDHQLKGWSSLNKARLIEFLKENLKAAEEPQKKVPRRERKRSPCHFKEENKERKRSKGKGRGV